MEKTLTQEEIAKVFAMYLGREVELQESAYQYLPNSLFNSTAITEGIIQDDVYLKINEESGYSLGINDIKLKLHSLDKISDDDAIEVAQMCGMANAEIIEHDENGISMKDDSYGFWIGFRSGYLSMYKNNELYHQNVVLPLQYLIQKGYAVPLFFGVNHWANGKTAIELDIAIGKQ